MIGVVAAAVVGGDGGVNAPEDNDAIRERMPSRHWATTKMMMMRDGSKESWRARASWLDILKLYALKMNRR